MRWWSSTPAERRRIVEETLKADAADLAYSLFHGNAGSLSHLSIVRQEHNKHRARFAFLFGASDG